MNHEPSPGLSSHMQNYLSNSSKIAHQKQSLNSSLAQVNVRGGESTVEKSTLEKIVGDFNEELLCIGLSSSRVSNHNERSLGEHQEFSFALKRDNRNDEH